MNDYSMPTYFQNMPVLNAPAYKPNPDNVAELKKIEEEIHAQAEKMLSAGTPDDKIHQKGQYTALERINQLVDPGSFCPLNTIYNPQDNQEEKIGIVSTGVVPLPVIEPVTVRV